MISGATIMETDDLSAGMSAATHSALACFPRSFQAPLFLDAASALGHSTTEPIRRKDRASSAKRRRCWQMGLEALRSPEKS